MNAAIEAELGPLLARVSRQVSPNDEMFKPGHWTHYLWVASSALHCIRRSMELAGKRDARSILDMASGHGRVLRVLRVAFPDAHTTACDIDRDGVEFCASAFGAVPVLSHADPARVDLDGPFDLVWCGSLFTHLDSKGWAGFFDLIEAELEPGALLVFTVFGAQIAEPWRSGAPDPELTPEGIAQILRGYDEVGFGHADYPGTPGWGDTVVTPEWVREMGSGRAALRLVDHWPAGWAGSQDVVTCVRA